MNGGAERTRLLDHKDIYQVTTLVILYDPYPSRGFPRTSRSLAHPSASRVPRRSLSFLPRRDSFSRKKDARLFSPDLILVVFCSFK